MSTVTGRASALFGARTVLETQNHVDALLAPTEELATLLQRLEAFRQFQEAYFLDQDRLWTSDGLGYVSHLTIDEIHLAIVGLNSAWLAGGGKGDHGKLLIGEHQVIEAIRLLNAADDAPHVVLGMTHHPLHVLREFDRVPALNRLGVRLSVSALRPPARTRGACRRSQRIRMPDPDCWRIVRNPTL